MKIWITALIILAIFFGSIITIIILANKAAKKMKKKGKLSDIDKLRLLER